MKDYFSTAKDIADFAANVVTAITLFAVFYSYFLSKRQAHFSVIEKCINDFRNFEKNNNVRGNTFKAYVDLVNEELFYMEKGYLPYDIAVEWIDGMIDYLPFIYNNKIINNSKWFNKSESQYDSNQGIAEIMREYPRVANFITINENIDFEKVYSNSEKRFAERGRLMIAVSTELRISGINGWLFRREIKRYTKGALPPVWVLDFDNTQRNKKADKC